GRRVLGNGLRGLGRGAGRREVTRRRTPWRLLDAQGGADVRACRGRVHDRPHRVGDPAVSTDDAALVLLVHVEVQHDTVALVLLLDAHLLGVAGEGAGEVLDELLHRCGPFARSYSDFSASPSDSEDSADA